MFELSNNDIKKIISTIVERIRTIISSEKNIQYFNLYIKDHDIIADSRRLTKDFHLSSAGAIHIYLLDIH